MTDAALAPAPVRRTPMPRRLAPWIGVAAATAAGLALASVAGLVLWDFGFDVKTPSLIGHIAAGSFLGVLACGVLARRVLPRRRGVRGLLAVVLLTGCILAGIAGLVTLGRLQTLDIWEHSQSVRFMLYDLAGATAVTTFLFLTMVARLFLPHGLVAIVPAALWISRRTRRQ
jgi:hypothetical protein